MVHSKINLYISKFTEILFSGERNCPVHHQNYYSSIKRRLKKLKKKKKKTDCFFFFFPPPSWCLRFSTSQLSCIIIMIIPMIMIITNKLLLFPLFGYSILLIPIRLTTALLIASVPKHSPFCLIPDI